uniref:Uncharacterized protein n=1 Tax=Romanomermis culicivorax TaxID=13658 RepID=A0A915KXX3_ROMCU
MRHGAIIKGEHSAPNMCKINEIQSLISQKSLERVLTSKNHSSGSGFISIVLKKPGTNAQFLCYSYN